VLLHQVLREEPRALRRINDKIPRDLETICLKAMAKAPGRRYKTSAYLADDLRHYLRREPIEARPVGEIERLSRWCLRNPRLALASATAALGLMAATFIAIIFAISQSTAAGRLRHEQQQTENALQESRAQRGLAEKAAEKLRTEQEATAAALRDAKRAASNLALDRGLALCSQNDAGQGLLWFARSLRDAAAAKDADLQACIRAVLAQWRPEVHSLRAVLPHDSSVLAAAFSPDGTRVATGSSDKSARIWETASGKAWGAALEHQGSIEAIAFSPDGARIATASSDKTARLWDVVRTKPLGPPLLHDGSVWCLAFSRDGKILATGADDNKVRLWDTTTGKQLEPVLQHKAAVFVLALSPDGKILATGSEDNVVRLWQFPTGTLMHSPLFISRILGGDDAIRGIRRRSAYRHGVLALAFSPDGGRLATVSGMPVGEARLWDITNNKRIALPLRQSDTSGSGALSVAFHPDGKSFVTGLWANKLLRWDAGAGRPIGEPLTHGGPVWACAFGSDGRIIVTGSMDHTARVWSTSTNKALGPPLPHPTGSVRVVAVSRDGEAILTAGDDTGARLWSLRRQQSFPTLEGKGDELSALDISVDGSIVVTASHAPDPRHRRLGPGHTQLWHPASGKLIQQELKPECPFKRCLRSQGRASPRGLRKQNGTTLGPQNRSSTRSAAPARNTNPGRGHQSRWPFGSHRR
jgi:WD40 repeat protein